MFLLHFLSFPDPTIGYGVHALQLQRELSLLASGGAFWFQATDLGQPGELEAACELLTTLPPELPVVNVLLGDGRSSHELLDQLRGLKVTYTVFESDILPLGWKENLQRSDLVITASDWGAEILRRELGGTPVAVVPEGVDPTLLHQWNRSTDLQPWQPHHRREAPLEECFRFLTVGKLESRKSYEELVAAFRLAFPDRPDVRLQLRLHNPFDPDYRQRAQALGGPEPDGRVLLVEGSGGRDTLSPEGMAELYRSSHAFVFPSKGEGWGLPLIEAISCGTPFVATHYSGPMQYLQTIEQSFSRIDHQLVAIEEPDFLRYHHFAPERPARWAQPDVPSLARQLRQVLANWPALREQAKANARTIHQRFSWAAAAETLIDVLQEQLLAPQGEAMALAPPPPDPDTPLDADTLASLLGRRSATMLQCAAHLNRQEQPRVLELGTTRSFRSHWIDTETFEPDPRQWDWGGGCGTYVIAALVPHATLETVDPEPAALQVSRRLCRPFGDRIQYLATLSSLHLANGKEDYDLIYMDHGETGPETAELHRHDAELIVQRSLLRPGGLILIDDQNVGEGIPGKGSLSIPYLLSQGFQLLTPPESYQALLQAPTPA
jgi:glycosyltransferase involved in cell wall biosynthesis